MFWHSITDDKTTDFQVVHVDVLSITGVPCNNCIDGEQKGRLGSICDVTGLCAAGVLFAGVWHSSGRMTE